MGLRYPKNMFVLKVCQQNVLYFYRILGFFYNNVYLQKHRVVILFWYKYKTKKYFLRSQENLICFLTISILRRVFSILLVRVIKGFVSVLIRIIGEVFLIRRVTFLKISANCVVYFHIEVNIIVDITKIGVIH